MWSNVKFVRDLNLSVLLKFIYMTMYLIVTFLFLLLLVYFSVFIIFSALHLAYFTFYPILCFHGGVVLFLCLLLIIWRLGRSIIADQKVVGPDIKLDGSLWTFGIIWAFEDAMMMIATFWVIFGPKMGIHGLFTNILKMMES